MRRQTGRVVSFALIACILSAGCTILGSGSTSAGQKPRPIVPELGTRDVVSPYLSREFAWELSATSALNNSSPDALNEWAGKPGDESHWVESIYDGAWTDHAQWEAQNGNISEA